MFKSILVNKKRILLYFGFMGVFVFCLVRGHHDELVKTRIPDGSLNLTARIACHAGLLIATVAVAPNPEHAHGEEVHLFVGAPDSDLFVAGEGRTLGCLLRTVLLRDFCRGFRLLVVAG
jgi:hypothetical protein